MIYKDEIFNSFMSEDEGEETTFDEPKEPTEETEEEEEESFE